MVTLYVQLTLLSDATFGSGEGVAGLLDEDVVHDEYGLPYIRGRTLKALLVQEAGNILFSLQEQQSPAQAIFRAAAQSLFGEPGSTLRTGAALHVGPACLPTEFRAAVKEAESRETISAPEVLDALTAIRRQTAIDDQTGAPAAGSLRASRVVLRQTTFQAPLIFNRQLDDNRLAFVAACVAGLRRGGTGSNRGRGRLVARLCTEDGQDITGKYLERFAQAIRR